MPPRALILRTAGTNCDAETAHAFTLAGASVERFHLNRILETPTLLNQFQLLSIPGGFSYGDDIAAGRIFANQLIHHLGDVLRRFIEQGKPIIGICNGFQVLIKTGLLPGAIAGHTGQTCTLAHNDTGRFIDKWVRLVPCASPCIWTAGLEDPLELPIAHGEGKFIPAGETIRQALHDSRQVVLTYSPTEPAAPDSFAGNPNGSIDSIAGICDPTGLIFGIMPHPERYVTRFQHPAWSRQSPLAEGHGLAIFRNAVRYVVGAVDTAA